MSDDFDLERNYWGDCCNTFFEERKHYVYASLMGIKRHQWSFHVPLESRIVDIGGGPVSMLLKTLGFKEALVVDPIRYPDWTVERYHQHGITVALLHGEDLLGHPMCATPFDEAWVYNCLQHVEDPVRILQNARKVARTVRIFEWIDIPPHDGHPHMLTKKLLDDALGIDGAVTELWQDGCHGRAYSGVLERSFGRPE